MAKRSSLQNRRGNSWNLATLAIRRARENVMSLLGRLLPSFDGPRYPSPYFYIPPKRRWWPLLTAFAAGGAGVLVLIGPNKQSADDPNQKAVAYQVRKSHPDNPSSAKKSFNAAAQRVPSAVAQETHAPDSGPRQSSEVQTHGQSNANNNSVTAVNKPSDPQGAAMAIPEESSQAAAAQSKSVETASITPAQMRTHHNNFPGQSADVSRRGLDEATKRRARSAPDQAEAARHEFTSPRAFKTTHLRSRREQQPAPKTNTETRQSDSWGANGMDGQPDQADYVLTRAPAEPIERVQPESGGQRWQTRRALPRYENAPAEERWGNQPFFPFFGSPSAEEPRVAPTLPNTSAAPDMPMQSPRHRMTAPAPRRRDVSAPRQISRSVAQQRANAQGFFSGRGAQSPDENPRYRDDARSQRPSWQESYDRGDWRRWRDNGDWNRPRRFGDLFGD
jgi:hypothetical protein